VKERELASACPTGNARIRTVLYHFSPDTSVHSPLHPKVCLSLAFITLASAVSLFLPLCPRQKVSRSFVTFFSLSSLVSANCHQQHKIEQHCSAVFKLILLPSQLPESQS